MKKGQQHSSETRKRIGVGVRQATIIRKKEESLVVQKMHKVGAAFMDGHPSNLAPSAIRNYGDFGAPPKETTSPVVPQKSVPIGQPSASEETVDERQKRVVEKREGTSGGRITRVAEQ